METLHPLETYIEKIGEIELSCNAVLRVGDPCYSEDRLYENIRLNNNAGMYPVMVECFGPTASRFDAGRVVQIYLELSNEDVKTFESVGSLGVDSGQMSMSDYKSWLENPPHVRGGRYEELIKMWGDTREGFVTPCNTIAISSTGYGDGCYELQVGKEKNGRIVAVRVIFIQYEAPTDEYDEFEEDEF